MVSLYFLKEIIYNINKYMKQENNILKVFFDLVKIYSPSGKEDKVSKYLIDFAKKNNLLYKKDKYKNLIIKVKGTGKPIALSAHMDTVEPSKNIEPMVKNGRIESKGDTILGADNKASIAAILDAIVKLKSDKIIHRPIEIIFTREEEIGLFGAKNFDKTKIDSKFGLTIDRSCPLGYIVIASPFVYVIDIEVKGKSAHAGSDIEKGINAIQVASKAIGKLKIGKISKDTSVNIGTIKGGHGFNTVPDRVNICAEVRSFIKGEALDVVKEMKRIFNECAKRQNAGLTFNHRSACTGYYYDKDDELIKKIVKVNKNLNFKTVFEKAGSASDANAFIEKGIKMINIAYGAKNAHSTKESIKVTDLKKLSNFIVEFVQN